MLRAAQITHFTFDIIPVIFFWGNGSKWLNVNFSVDCAEPCSSPIDGMCGEERGCRLAYTYFHGPQIPKCTQTVKPFVLEVVSKWLYVNFSVDCAKSHVLVL
jgi:hypothetical protein